MNHKQKRGKLSWIKGVLSENIAVFILLFKGYSILKRNFKVGRGTNAGEIDIIANKKDLIVFVEVKFRADISLAAEAITKKQKDRIIKSADIFLSRNSDIKYKFVRFDAILITPNFFPKHIKNAWVKDF